jgi:hypothetical protein
MSFISKMYHAYNSYFSSNTPVFISKHEKCVDIKYMLYYFFLLLLFFNIVRSDKYLAIYTQYVANHM